MTEPDSGFNAEDYRGKSDPELREVAAANDAEHASEQQQEIAESQQVRERLDGPDGQAIQEAYEAAASGGGTSPEAPAEEPVDPAPAS